MSAISIQAAKLLHPMTPSQKPFHKPKSYASWSAVALYENMEFINFYERTSTGAR